MKKRCYGTMGDARRACEIRHVWCGYKDLTKCPSFREMTEEQYKKMNQQAGDHHE